MAGFCVFSCELFIAKPRGPQSVRGLSSMVRLTAQLLGVVRRVCGPAGRSKVQPARCAGQQQRGAARPERLEEEGQYGWWPALDGERYRAWLHKFSVRADPPSARASMLCEMAHYDTPHSLIGVPRGALPLRFRSRPQSRPRGTS